MYDRKTIRRRRAVLFILVACSLILVTASFGDGLRSIERGALEVFGPVQEGASTVLKPVRDGAGWVGDTLDAKGEVEKLRAERDRLRIELAESRGALGENAELRKALDMRSRLGFADQGPKVARVISEPANVWSSRLIVDQGTRDGVREGDAVINDAGLVGRVRRASGGNAQVLLITDTEMGVSAKINDTGFPGIIETEVGDPNDLRLNFLGRGEAARKGQTVVTSGTTSQRYPSFFPEGIPIGRITDVDDDEGTVRIDPFAELRRLDVVQIVTEPAT